MTFQNPVLMMNFFLYVTSFFVDLSILYCGNTRSTNAYKYPWVASLQHANHSGNLYMGHFCDAALVSDRWLITSAYCATKYEKEEIRVVTNVPNLFQYNLNEVYKIEKTVVHPFYNKLPFVNNIAMLRTSKPISIHHGEERNSEVNTICLPPFQDHDYQPHKLSLVGWGGYPTIRGTDVDLLTEQDLVECDMMAERYFNITLTPDMSCFKPQKRANCSFDQGGLLQAYHSDGLAYAHGIVSFGNACTEKAGVYTKLQDFRDWIHHTMKYSV